MSELDILRPHRNMPLMAVHARSTKIGDRPYISLSGIRAAYVGPALDLTPHRNAAATVAVSFACPFALTVDGANGTKDSIANIYVIPAGTRHHLRATSPMAFVYLDALSDEVGILASLDLSEARKRLVLELGPDFDGHVDTICRLLGIPARHPADSRVAIVAQRMAWNPNAFKTASDAARVVGLSASRFQALFRQSLGVPFRHYRLWRKMSVVARQLEHGQTLTTAAHEAGFASSAHLSMTFRGMFGIAPSALLATGVRIKTEVSSQPGGCAGRQTGGV